MIMMKANLLLAFLMCSIYANAQTTYYVDWGGEVQTNGGFLSINLGDTVVWTWIDDEPHRVKTTPIADEQFDSGVLTGIGSTFSHTFNSSGNSTYFCFQHSAPVYGAIWVPIPPYSYSYSVNWYQGANGNSYNLHANLNTTITWTWIDGQPHSVESFGDEGNESGDSFDSGVLTGVGQTFSHTFQETGPSNFRCAVHPNEDFGTINYAILGVKKSEKSLFEIESNPVNDLLKLRLPSSAFAIIYVTDLMGKKLFGLSFSGKEAQLDVSKLSSGFYLLTVENENGKSSKKFLKQ